MGGGVNPHRLCFYSIEVNMRPSCSECGSQDVLISLNIFWDELKGTWTAETNYWDDDVETAHCYNCDTDIYLTASFRYTIETAP